MKSPFFNLYRKFPISFQNIFISAYGIKLYYIRYGKFFREQLKILEEKDTSDLESEIVLQNAGVQDIVQYAYNYSPFYHDLYRGIDISQIRTADDLKKLPIIDKEIFRSNLHNIYTIPKNKAELVFTGGTTGKSLEIRYLRSDLQRRLAYLINFEKQHGVLPGMRRASFNGRQFIDMHQSKKIFWRYNYIRKQKLYSTFNMTDNNMGYYIEDLNRFKPEVINGFVSAIYLLADYALRNKITFTFSPIAVFTTSETLLPFHREKIEKAFRCPVRDQYASGEGAPFITECKYGNLHYDISTGAIESLKTDYGNEMLVTSFTTHGTPLIRYRIGDMWEPSDELCPCGNCHPLVKKIEGRNVDFLYSPENGIISLSHLADVIKGMPNCICNMQFIQHKKDSLLVLMVVDKNIYSQKYEDMVFDELRYRFGNKMNIQIKIVDNIPVGPSGKYRLILRDENI